ncbi:hypothetical protein MROS_1504 [Melioribacter roseus P3M-2]|uniref:Alpha/beta hydrolase fold-3 domain-containing protein n=1 Tax=Melioribacter roseus (strain DSM 23840 / JCM 17771 / VKM B-2668 / P3M-2) TaxID=1191523 RepID=I7A4A4_MELRP|nr:alpha/beta hydrolase [Melioribacter roseus]AFN74741.1 hypothetical protein MROS_1504 [Melioribacter roseus P3M-2]
MKTKIIILVLLFVSAPLFGQYEFINIWNGNAPGTKNTAEEEKYSDERFWTVNQPGLVFYKARESKGITMLVLPGGGYHHLAFVKEGVTIAKWLNNLGIDAYVLKYRLNPEDALDDAQRAVCYVRRKAKNDKIGAIGFSAGGHLAANVMLSPKRIFVDSIDNQNFKPDFAALIYPWLQNLYEKVKEELPPLFIAHAADDTRVPVRESLNFIDACVKINVYPEAHIFFEGSHGFGMEKEGGYAASEWTSLFEKWLVNKGILNVTGDKK